MVDATVWDEGERRKSDFSCGAKPGPWGGASGQRSASGQTMSRLVRTIEGEIIPPAIAFVCLAILPYLEELWRGLYARPRKQSEREMVSRRQN